MVELKLIELYLKVILNNDQFDRVAVDNLLSRFRKIDGYAASDSRLDLSDSPFGRIRVAHQHPGGEHLVQGALLIFMIRG